MSEQDYQFPEDLVAADEGFRRVLATFRNSDLSMVDVDGIMDEIQEITSQRRNDPMRKFAERGFGARGIQDWHPVCDGKRLWGNERALDVYAALDLARTMPKPAEVTGSYTFGDLSIDTASHTVRVAGEDVSLTPKEFDLLVFLASNKGIALSREKILQKVWNYDYFGEDRTVDTHVKMLRGHLGKCRSYIATVWGIGYKFDPDATR